MSEKKISLATLSWKNVDDGVMGGVSSTQTIKTVDELLLFEGRVSLENNGGFCSIQAPLPPDFSRPMHHLTLSARGDGKRYQCRIHVKETYVRFAVSFTPTSELQTFAFDAKEFEAVFRGRKIDGLLPLSAYTPESIAFLIADKQEGTFSLSVGQLLLKSRSE